MSVSYQKNFQGTAMQEVLKSLRTTVLDKISFGWKAKRKFISLKYKMQPLQLNYLQLNMYNCIYVYA